MSCPQRALRFLGVRESLCVYVFDSGRGTLLSCRTHLPPQEKHVHSGSIVEWQDSSTALLGWLRVGTHGISDEGCNFWRPSSPFPGLGLNQPSVVRKRDGTLVPYMGDEGPAPKRALSSTSSDGGETRSTAVDLEIPNQNSSLEVLGLEDGRWIMAYNDTERGRHRLALALSNDEGATWEWNRYLEKAETGADFHFPFLIQGRDGSVHVTYTHKPGRRSDKSIKRVALGADWILKGD